jgi:ABC-2 type transport system permease protein
MLAGCSSNKDLLRPCQTHFVSLAQAILYRNAGFDIVWPSFAAVTAIGVVFFLSALVRFRRTISVTQA